MNVKDIITIQAMRASKSDDKTLHDQSQTGALSPASARLAEHRFADVDDLIERLSENSRALGRG